MNLIKSKHGSVTGFMLLFLPLVTTAALVAFAGAMSIHVTEQSNLICRNGVLDAEAHAVKNLKQLVALNPAARVLRAADKVSKLTLAIPIYGQLSEVSVQEARMILHSLQIGLIQKANLQMKADLLQLKYKLGGTVSFGQRNFIQAEIANSPTLAVDATPAMNLTPDYKPKKNFAELMLSQLNWTIHLENVIPDWLSSFLKDHGVDIQSFNMNLSCGSSPQESKQEAGEQSWEPVLRAKSHNQSQIIRAKQLLNSF